MLYFCACNKIDVLKSFAFTVYRPLSSPTANESRFTPLPLQIDPTDWIWFLWIEQDYWAAFPDVSHPEYVWKRSLCVSFCCLNQRDVSPEPLPIWWHTALWNTHFLYFTSSLPPSLTWNNLYIFFLQTSWQFLISRGSIKERGRYKRNEGKKSDLTSNRKCPLYSDLKEVCAPLTPVSS